MSAIDYKKESGRRLQRARNDKKLSLADLSEKLGNVLSASRIGNYEQGTRSMGVEEALALARALNVNAAYLLCVDDAEGEMTQQEERLLRSFRALPEKDRNDYARRIEALALVYREPVPDENMKGDWDASKSPKRKPAAPQQK